jgi:hypothetical protein
MPTAKKGLKSITSKVKLGDMVAIEWVDAWVDSAMYTTDQEGRKLKGLTTLSGGFLVSATDQGVAVARTICKEGNQPYRGIHFIPAKIVQSVRVLK